MAREEPLPIYVIDTSSLVNLRLWRPARQFPEPWGRLDDLVGDGRLVSPDRVLSELHSVDDPLFRWALTRKRSLFRKSSRGIIEKVQEILARFPELVNPNNPADSADPFVVALAISEKDKHGFLSQIVVVTDEKYAPGRPRIPHVCEAYGLRYLTIHQMFLFEGWTL